MFPKNTWYVAATSAEIDEKPLGRTICGERIVFYRGLENQVAEARSAREPATRSGSPTTTTGSCPTRWPERRRPPDADQARP